MHEKKDKKYFYSQNLFQLKESFQAPSTRKGEWRISVEGTKKEQEEFACLLIHPARCGGEQRRKEGGVAEGPGFKFEFDLELGERSKNIEVETAAYVVKSTKVRTIDQRSKTKDTPDPLVHRARGVGRTKTKDPPDLLVQPSARRGKNKDQRPNRPPRASSARRGKNKDQRPTRPPRATECEAWEEQRPKTQQTSSCIEREAWEEQRPKTHQTSSCAEREAWEEQRPKTH